MGDERYDGQIEKRIDKLELTIEAHRELINNLRLWRIFQIGAALGAGVTTGTFAPHIAAFLHSL